MAFTSIFSNKLRSFLTMLGIIIGISSVIVLVGIGEGTKQKVEESIEGLGTNLITVSIMGNRVKPITLDDVKELKTKPGIKEVAPVISSSVTLKAGTTTYSTNLNATVPEYKSVKKTDVAYGRFIEQEDLDTRGNVAVIGMDTATSLFNTVDVLGSKMTIEGKEFTIIGLLKPTGSSSSGSADDVVIIPLTTGQRLLQTAELKNFSISAKDKASVSEAMGYLKLFLNKISDNDSTAYRVFDQTSLLETATTSSEQLTTMLGGIAAISLLVGGIGIMNIMLVSVIERTKEIGIRKAIGAKRSVILAQFLIESSAISFIGGLIGVGLGYLLGALASSYSSYQVVISNDIVLSAFLFSIVVGVVFGMYPAVKASKLNPIDALRFE